MDWLRKLLCQHRWKIINQVSCEETYRGTVVGHRMIYTMQCEHCGNIKSESVKS
jgi:hypothetical protein